MQTLKDKEKIASDMQDEDDPSMNGSGTEAQIDTPLTQWRSPTVLDLRFEDMRQFLHAERRTHRARSPLGYRYSNLLEQIEEYRLSERDWQRENLKRSIALSVMDIRDMKRGVRQLRSPETLLLEFMPGTAH